MENSAGFGKWRTRLWPIHQSELKKVIPMMMMFFLIVFNFQLLHTLKDTLVVTANGSGAEIIPFLKLWGVLPSAVVFAVVYMALSNRVSKPALFYLSIVPFVIFFSLFPLLFAHQGVLHPTVLADNLQDRLPEGFMGLIAIARVWTFSLFYIMAELWGSIVLSLLFWGFANDTNNLSESVRFYPIFGLGQCSGILAGMVVMGMKQLPDALNIAMDHWQFTLNSLVLLVVLSALMIMAIYGWMQNSVVTGVAPLTYKQKQIPKTRKPFLASLRFLMRSKVLCLLSLLVIAYAVCINLVEVTWKNQLKIQYPDPVDFLEMMGLFTSLTSLIATVMMLFVGGNVIRRFGWRASALFTPVVLLITGLGFFGCVICKEVTNCVVGMLGTTPLMLAVGFGMVQNIMSKSSKYAIFDPTKEMVFIALDDEHKVKGKAAVDVIGARLGKSGGAFLQQGLIIAFGSVSAITPYLGVLLLLVIAMWFMVIAGLSHFMCSDKQACHMGNEQ